MQKGFAGIILLTIVLVVAVGAGAYYLGYDHGWEKPREIYHSVRRSQASERKRGAFSNRSISSYAPHSQTSWERQGRMGFLSESSLPYKVSFSFKDARVVSRYWTP